jgi:hypothetical protein
VLRTSPLSDAALGFSLGYFATDLLLLLLYYPSFGGPEMAVHHVAALASVAAAAFQVRRKAACPARQRPPFPHPPTPPRLHPPTHQPLVAPCPPPLPPPQGQAHAYTLALLATECTTPFVNLRYLLDKGGWRQHPAYTFNGVALLVRWGQRGGRTNVQGLGSVPLAPQLLIL